MIVRFGISSLFYFMTGIATLLAMGRIVGLKTMWGLLLLYVYTLEPFLLHHWIVRVAEYEARRQKADK